MAYGAVSAWLVGEEPMFSAAGLWLFVSLHQCIVSPFNHAKEVTPPPLPLTPFPHLSPLRGSGLRALRRGCVASLLEKLFEGKPGARHALSWVRLHHGDKSDNNGLDDIGLVDWMYGLRDVAVTGVYRASLGEAHTVGENGPISRRGEVV